MRLSLLSEYFSVVGDYHNSLIKKKRGKYDLRATTRPELTDKYLKWLSGKNDKK